MGISPGPRRSNRPTRLGLSWRQIIVPLLVVGSIVCLNRHSQSALVLTVTAVVMLGLAYGLGILVARGRRR